MRKDHARQQRITRSCRGSTPDLLVDLLGVFFNEATNPGGLLTQMLQLAHILDPGLLRTLGVGSEFILNRFRDIFTEREPALGRPGLSASKDGVRDFESGLHKVMFPYLWEKINGPQQ